LHNKQTKKIKIKSELGIFIDDKHIFIIMKKT